MARSPSDHLAQFIGSAVADVREKLVEEAWFGRASASQERVSEEMSVILSQHPESVPAPAVAPSSDLDKFLAQSTNIHHSDPGGGLGKPLTWDEVCAQYGRESPAHEHEPDRDLER